MIWNERLAQFLFYILRNRRELLMNFRFIGETSCGFKKGHVYDIEIVSRDAINSAFPIRKYEYMVFTHSGLRCPYGSLEAVFRNWEPCTNELKKKNVHFLADVRNVKGGRYV